MVSTQSSAPQVVQSPAMGMAVTPTTMSPHGSTSPHSAIKRARSSFAVTELHETPYHGDHVADDEKADDVRHFKVSMGSLCWVQTPELWRGGMLSIWK